MSKRKLYRAVIEFYWWLEHRKRESVAIYGYRKRKAWERKYIERFNENIYGEAL